MTYTTDIDSRRFRVGYYIAFEGIATRIATHDMSAAGVSGTFVVCIKEDTLSGGERSLDRESHFVEEGGLSWSCLDVSTARSLFVRRGGTDVQLSASISAGATALTLSTGTNTWADGTTVYLGRETITLDTHTGSGTYNITRAVNGSTASAHAAYSTISDRPRFWYTRGCTLYAVNLDTGTSKALWYGSLSGPIGFTDGLHTFEAVGRINELFQRPICSGFRDYRPDSTSIESGLIRFTFRDSVDQYEFAPGAQGGFVRCDVGGRTAFYYFEAAGLTSTYLEVDPAMRVQLAAEMSSDGTYQTVSEIVDISIFDDNPEVTLRQVDRVTGRVGDMALKVMRSSTGNSSLDILPGRDYDTAGGSYFFRRRMGAAIPSALIDSDAWQSIVAGNDNDVDWLDQEETLGDYLDRMLWRTGGYAYITSGGKLSWKQYGPATNRGALPTYDASSAFLTSETSVWDAEDDAPGHATALGNYNPLTRDFRRRLDVTWYDDAPIYGDREGGYEYESKAIRIGYGPESYTAIEAAFDRVRARRAFGGRTVSYRIPWSLHETFVPGYRFSLTDSRLPDNEGNTGISARPYEVVSWTPDWGAGFVTIECDEVLRGWLIAPCAFISSWDAGNVRATLDTSGPEATFFDDANPGSDFIVNCSVRVYDASASPPFSSSDVVQVTALTGTTLTFGLAPVLSGGGAPAAGDLIVMEVYVDTGNTNDVGADVQDFAFGADSNFEVGASISNTRDGPRWG